MRKCIEKAMSHKLVMKAEFVTFMWQRSYIYYFLPFAPKISTV